MLAAILALLLLAAGPAQALPAALLDLQAAGGVQSASLQPDAPLPGLEKPSRLEELRARLHAAGERLRALQAAVARTEAALTLVDRLQRQRQERELLDSDLRHAERARLTLEERRARHDQALRGLTRLVVGNWLETARLESALDQEAGRLDQARTLAGDRAARLQALKAEMRERQAALSGLRGRALALAAEFGRVGRALDYAKASTAAAEAERRQLEAALAELRRRTAAGLRALVRTGD
jgi:chromosome segregation ATPase